MASQMLKVLILPCLVTPRSPFDLLPVRTDPTHGLSDIAFHNLPNLLRTAGLL